MKEKRGLVMGVANDKSIAWGMARTLHAHGAEMAFTYQGEAFGKRVKPLAESIGSDIVLDCDVSKEEDLDRVFETLEKEWGRLDFLIHAIAYSDKEELKGRYVDTSLDNFLTSLHISCYSFTSVMRRASALMTEGGSAVTLSYYGAEKAMPNYNVMGVAKAALEASVRYMAADLGPEGIRVNAISAGPMRTPRRGRDRQRQNHLQIQCPDCPPAPLGGAGRTRRHRPVPALRPLRRGDR